MADTTTTLNTGSGGDVMDETSALQSDGLTTAKRPRVVLGGDAGYNGTINDLVQPVNADPGNSPMSLPALMMGLVNDAVNAYVDNQLRPFSLTADGRLRTTTVHATVYIDFFGDTSPLNTDPAGFINCSVNPWGI